MASVNIQKLHGSEAGAVLAHDYRHDGKDVAYRNEHVNPELSKNNGELYYRDVHAKGGKAHDEYQRLRAEGYNPAKWMKPFYELLSYNEAESVRTGYDAYRALFDKKEEENP